MCSLRSSRDSSFRAGLIAVTVEDDLAAHDRALGNHLIHDRRDFSPSRSLIPRLQEPLWVPAAALDLDIEEVAATLGSPFAADLTADDRGAHFLISREDGFLVVRLINQTLQPFGGKVVEKRRQAIVAVKDVSQQ